jgi:antitoxin (DNA-binding transcriptional repressor) of toxin-antitoxin stability system
MALAEIKDDLSRFLREAETQEIVITRHGKPAGVLIDDIRIRELLLASPSHSTMASIFDFGRRKWTSPAPSGRVTTRATRKKTVAAARENVRWLILTSQLRELYELRMPITV